MPNRDDYSKYRGDVYYEEWRRGLPEGSISEDRIRDGFYEGRKPDSLACCEEDRRNKRRQEAEYARMEEEDFRQQCEGEGDCDE